MTKYKEKPLILFILLTLIATTVGFGQAINIRLGVRDSIYSSKLKENRKFVTYVPQGYDTSVKRYSILYLLDGSEERLQFFSSMMKFYFQDSLIIVAIENTDRDRDMMPLSAPSYPVAKAGADNFILFIRDELIQKIEGKNRTNGKRIICGQSLSGVLTLYALLTQPQMFDGYVANSVGWYADMDYFFSPLVDKAFQNPNKYKDKIIFFANSENDSYDPRKEILKSMDLFSNKVHEKLDSSIIYKYETYSKYGHVPYPAFYDAMKFILANNKRK